MIHALQYEPQGQRQRFEPREQQRAEPGEQDRHIHLHLHLNLTMRASQKRSTHPNAMSIARIFAALLGATVMLLWIFISALSLHDGPPTPPNPLGNLAWVSIFAGLAFAWCAIGVLLLDAWRLRLFGSLVLLLSICFLFLHGLLFGAILAPLGPLALFLFLVQPFITALLLMWVSREARALRQRASAHRRLSFVVVSGMALALLGGLLLDLHAMLGGVPPLLFLPAMCAAVIVAICTLFGLSRSRESMQARPKDASPSDVDSPQEPLGYRD